MRLRLSIHRNGLPVTNVLWTVGQTASYVAATANTTISQLLDNVNEIIPLESEEWGLEDYVVEVRGFECLHFCELGSVLKDEDEVTIRPLQSTDLRFRKLSGRHQIAHDGKHLIDGVAFGRPFLRIAPRPAINIPPRKRRRLLSEEEGRDAREEIETLQPQLLLRAASDDADENGDSDKENDADYVPGIDEDEEEDSDGDVLEHEEEALEDGEASYPVARDRIGESSERSLRLDGTGERERGTSRRSERRTRFLLEQERPSEAPTERQSYTPGEYENPLLDYFASAGNPAPESSNTWPESESVTVSRIRPAKHVSNTPSGPTERSDAPILTSPVDIKVELNTAESSEDEHEAMDYDSENSESESEPADLRRGISGKSSEESSEKSSESSSEDSSDDSSEDSSDDPSDREILPGARDWSASSDSSSSDQTSDEREDDVEDDGDDDDSSSSNASNSSSDSSSEESDSSSATSSSDEDSSGSEPEEISSHEPGQRSATSVPVGDSMTAQHIANAPKTLVTKPPTTTATSVPPGSGRPETRKRNQRRRDHFKIESLKAQGLLPHNAGRRELAEYISNGALDSEKVSSKDEISAQKSREAAEFEAKRQQLLLALASGGIEVDQPRRRMEQAETGSPQERVTSYQPTHPSHSRVEEAESATIERPAHLGEAPEALQRKTKVDVAGSRTRDDIHDDEESWKDKISMMAVECCEDGIELSAPPFPFVQRWDPQQQLNNRRNNRSKNKRRKRNYDQYYEDEAQDYNYDNQGYDYEDQEYYYGDEEYLAAEPELNYDDEPYEENAAAAGAIGVDRRVETEVNDQIMRDTEADARHALRSEEAEDDLPPLPSDLSTLKHFTLEEAVPGAVIAFRQLTVSQATNWEPKITDIRTARIDTSTDGMLELTLAKRDTPRKNKSFDNETGKRIFGRFEMPYSDNEDDNEGYMEVSYDELMDPKLVREAGSGSIVGNGQEANKLYQGPSAEVFTEHTESNQQPSQPEHPVGRPKEHVRSKALQLIRDAGFRTSLGSEVESVIRNYGTTSTNNPANTISTPLRNDGPGSVSPRFHGIGSSPPRDESNDETPRAQAPRSRERLPSSNGPASIIDLYGVSSPTRAIPSATEASAADQQRQSFDHNISFETAPEGPSNNGDTSTTSHTLVGEQDRPDSENEFPEVEDILSSAKSSFESIKREAADSPARGSPTANRVSESRAMSESGSAAVSDTSLKHMSAIAALKRKSETAAKPAKKRGRPRNDQAETPLAQASTSQLPRAGTSTQSSSRKESLAADSDENDFDVAVGMDFGLGADTEDPAAAPFSKQLAENTLNNNNLPPPSSAPPASAYTIDLTLSSDPPAPADDNDNESDENYNSELGLPAGEGWVRKRKARSVQPYGFSSSQPVIGSAHTRRTTRQASAAAAATYPTAGGSTGVGKRKRFT
ncbi:hypothetical protein L228DRAFT_245223 [Xylona heveae TC161]|uniref:DUF7357 domain-containing protein n=1 Tax=Xylona heveae (strain CBS 132557 / TC161) TaxID=1328760 RepID=A0A165I394_XYLHT|nr:hypothetical protein L228DRAFT_245223 [Xylona heveae TC161]KZF24313.1 hypothetical protein L228DRAFT_245223 [Xylona heveae TC161]